MGSSQTSGTAAEQEFAICWEGLYRLWIVHELDSRYTLRSVLSNQNPVIRTEPLIFHWTGLLPENPIRFRGGGTLWCFLETIGNAMAPRIPTVVTSGASAEMIEVMLTDALHTLLICQRLVATDRASPKDDLGRLLLKLSHMNPSIVSIIMRLSLQRSLYAVTFDRLTYDRFGQHIFEFEVSGKDWCPASIYDHHTHDLDWRHCTANVFDWVDGETIAALDLNFETSAQINERKQQTMQAMMNAAAATATNEDV